MQAQTYLHFNGNCEEAMTFYADVLGGEITQQMTFSDAPESSLTFPEEVMDLIMHSTLVAGDLVIMASDYLNQKEEFNSGNNFAVSINSFDEDEAVTVFNGLSEGGIIFMPFEEAFWGGKFGMLRDKYGVQWMVSLLDESHA
ncbi:VOC family protein [Tenacibaculum sp. IB213877]|uniref:VOC family protein n=1 Tax=Tenacibaculum sp. IB213877 TaxID=3097351 RepID=UPI002A5A7B04|nr:VOC family protein [Tenacibaculum sp. IB213877]MDY0779607.1 VOC family protein [Tenacibaculum sp. IB213877]